MRDPFRQRVGQAAEAAKTQSQRKVYDKVRISWQGHGVNQSILKKRLDNSEIVELLARPPYELSMEQLVALGDHIELTGLIDVEPESIAPTASARDAFPLRRVVDDGVESKKIGKNAAMRFAFWTGYIAAPALAHVGRFEDAIHLLAHLTHRLGEPDYEGIDGGGGSADPDLRFLILAPALAGLTQYCPTSLGGPAAPGYVGLSSYFQRMMGLAPLTECVLLRLVCLGIVARHPAVQGLLEEAHLVAVNRYEKELANAFQLFRDNPGLLGAREPSQPVAA